MDFFSSPYTAFRERALLLGETARAVYRTDGMAAVPERLVRCIWYDQMLDKSRIRTADGRKVDIYSPGEWNSGPGPDFSEAFFRIEGEDPVRGDIELHVRSADWRRHGHHKNPEYSNVALHVAVWNDAGTPHITTARGENVPQVILADCLDEDLATLSARIDMENYPFCSDERTGLCGAGAEKEPGRLLQLLEMAGRERLFNKARRFRLELRRISFDEAFYRGIMEGLGYRHNKAPFRKLAEIIPLSTVRRLLREAPKLDRTNILLAVYSGASGLFSNIEINMYDAEARAYAELMQSLWDKYKEFIGPVRLHKKDWTIAGVRPANFPLRRIAGLSLLMSEKLGASPGDHIIRFGENLKSAVGMKDLKKALGEFRDLLVCEAYGYWANHIVAGGKHLDSAPALIGKPLAEAIVLNTVAPLLLCHSAQQDDTELRDRIVEFFSVFPTLDNHRISKLMAYRIWGKSGTKKNIAAESIQQGLIQVFFDFCDGNIRNCAECPFPKMLDIADQQS